MNNNLDLESTSRNIHHDLIEGCRNGDRNAQFRIYKLYYKAMYNTALRIVNDTAEAEDIMQESFLNAFQRLHSYTGEGSFGSWLKRIVINNSLDIIRKTRESVPLEEPYFNIPDTTEESDESFSQMKIAEIKAAISQLQEDYRVILSLHLFDGYDHEEMSEILGISNQLSRTRYSRARQKLIAVMRDNQLKRSYIYN